MFAIITSKATEDTEMVDDTGTQQNVGDPLMINDSSLTTSTPRSGNKRRPGRVVVKYKKVSLKQSSSSNNSTSDQTSTGQDESVQGNKTRRMKPKSSPQTMIYKPSKNKLIFATSPPTVEQNQEEPTTMKQEMIEPESSTTTTERSTTTTTRSRIYIPSSTTSEPHNSEQLDTFIRPTARSRIRISRKPLINNATESPVEIEREPVVNNRVIVRSRIRSTTTTTTTTQSPTTATPKFIRPTRRPSGTRSSMFPVKNEKTIEDKIIHIISSSPLPEPMKLEDVNPSAIDNDESGPAVKIIEAFPLEADDVPIILGNAQTEEEHLDVEESIRNVETKIAATEVEEESFSQPEPQHQQPRIQVRRRKPISSSSASNPAVEIGIRPAVVVVDDEAKLRLEKYEMEKAKQLERLRHNNNNNNNRHNSQGTAHKTDDDKEMMPAFVRIAAVLPQAFTFSSSNQEDDFAQPLLSDYGTKVPYIRREPSAPPKLKKEEEKVVTSTTPLYPVIPQRKPEIIYTPPVRDYQPPASFYNSERPNQQPITRYVKVNVSPPPVTYEPPHANYQPPSPAPPPRIYVPPTEEFKPPSSGR